MRLLTEIGLFIYRIFTPFRTARLEKDLANAKKIISNSKNELQNNSLCAEDCYYIILDQNSIYNNKIIEVKADDYTIEKQEDLLVFTFFENKDVVRVVTIQPNLFKAIY